MTTTAGRPRAVTAVLAAASGGVAGVVLVACGSGSGRAVTAPSPGNMRLCTPDVLADQV